MPDTRPNAAIDRQRQATDSVQIVRRFGHAAHLLQGNGLAGLPAGILARHRGIGPRAVDVLAGILHQVEVAHQHVGRAQHFHITAFTHEHAIGACHFLADLIGGHGYGRRNADLPRIDYMERLGTPLVDLVLRRKHRLHFAIAVVIAVNVKRDCLDRAFRQAVLTKIGAVLRLDDEPATGKDAHFPRIAFAVVMLAKTDTAALLVRPKRILGLVIIRVAGAGGLPRALQNIPCFGIVAHRLVKVLPHHQAHEARVGKVILAAIRVVIQTIPCQLANVRVKSVAGALHAHENRARAFNGNVLGGGRALVIPVAIIANVADSIGCSPRRVLIVGIARERLGVFTGLLFQAQHGFDLGLDLVEHHGRLPALLQRSLLSRRQLLVVEIIPAAFGLGTSGCCRLFRIGKAGHELGVAVGLLILHLLAASQQKQPRRTETIRSPPYAGATIPRRN